MHGTSTMVLKPKVNKNIKKKVKKTEPEFKCEFCGNVFAFERAYSLHMCAKKQRWLDRDLKHIKVAFMVFQKFHTSVMHATKAKTYAQFSNSKLYMDFVKFARYLQDINALKPELFIDFVFKGAVKITDWRKPYIYEVYLREMNKRESATDALERNFLLMQQWAKEKEEDWTDFFRKIEPTIAVLWLRNGRISPWVLYMAPSGDDLMCRMSDEQVALVTTSIDPEFWSERFANNKSEAQMIREELKLAGL